MVQFIPTSIIFVAFFLFHSTIIASASPAEGRLIQKLFTNYSRLTRPTASEKDVVNVTIGMSLLQILNVNEKQQILSSNIWLRTVWHDIGMIWNPVDYDNITVVRLPMSNLWKPDILVYNIADRESFQSSHYGESINAYVTSNGTVLFVPPLILKTTCKMDVTWFPFDEQRCEIKFGSWTHSALEMNLEFVGGNLTFDMNDYTTNGEWKLMGYKTERIIKIYDCCPEPYVSVSFILHIKRERMYYFFNLIVPCLLIGFLAVLGFTLPPDSGEKLSLGVTVLFSLIVFLNMIAESMPSNSDAVPLLGTYFNCVMFMIASSVVSTIVINLKVRSPHHPQKEVGGAVTRKLLFNILPWMLRMETNNEFDPLINDMTSIGLEEVTPAAATPFRENGERENEDAKGLNGGPSPERVVLGVKNKTDNVERDSDGILRKKWMYVAFVVDRFCLAVSIIFIIVSIVVLLVSQLCLK